MGGGLSESVKLLKNKIRDENLFLLNDIWNSKFVINLWNLWFVKNVWFVKIISAEWYISYTI